MADNERRIVEFAWVEKAERGFVALNMMTGTPQNCQSHRFDLDQPMAEWIGSELQHAMAPRQGKLLNGDAAVAGSCKEPWEEDPIVLRYGEGYANMVEVSRPFECDRMNVEGAEVQLHTKNDGRLYLACRDAEAAQRVGRQLAYNELTAIVPSDDILNARFFNYEDLYAVGMSEEQLAKINARYWYCGPDHWRWGLQFQLPMMQFDCEGAPGFEFFFRDVCVLDFGTNAWAAKLKYESTMAAEMAERAIRYGTKVILRHEPPVVSLCLVVENRLYALGFTDEEKVRLNEHYHPKTDSQWAMGTCDPQAYEALVDIVQRPWDS